MAETNFFDQFDEDDDGAQPGAEPATSEVVDTAPEEGNFFEQFEGAEEPANFFDQFAPPEPEPEPAIPEPEPTFGEDMLSAYRAGTAGLAQSFAELRRQYELGQYSPINYMTDEQKEQIFQDTGVTAYSQQPNFELMMGYLTDEQKAQRDKDMAGDTEIAQLEEASRLLGERVQERTPTAVVEDPWSMRGIAGSIVQSGTRMAPGVALSLLMANPAPAMATVGLDVYGSELAQGREMGLTEEESKSRAFLMAAAEGITEAVPVSAIIGKLGKGKIKNIFKATTTEAAQEALTEALQLGLDAGMYEEDASFENAIEALTSPEGLEQIAYAATVGAGMGVVIGGPGAIAADIQTREQEARQVQEQTALAAIEDAQRRAEELAAAEGGDALDQAAAGSQAAEAAGAIVQQQYAEQAARLSEQELQEAEAQEAAERERVQAEAAKRYERELRARQAAPAEAQRAEQIEAEVQEAEFQRELQKGEEIEAEAEVEAARPKLGSIMPEEVKSQFTNQEESKPEPAPKAKEEPLALPDLRPSTVVVDREGVAVGPLSGSQMDTQIRQQFQEQTDVDTTKGERLREIPVKLSGMDILIENPKGSTRTGTRPDGSTWSVKFKGSHYGKIKGVRGADNEGLDVFLGSQNPTSQTVFVMDQIQQATGAFDEHKVFIGFNNQMGAVRAYLQNHEAGWKAGPVTEMTMEEFKAWAMDGTRKTEPLSDVTPQVAMEGDLEAMQERAVAKGRRRPKLLYKLPEGMSLRRDEEVLPGGGVEFNIELVDSEGNVRGGITGDVIPDTEEVKIAVSKLDEDLQGQRIGLEMYNEVLKDAYERGYDLTSDISVSAAAQRIYEALERRGATVIRNPDAYEGYNGSLVTNDARIPVYRVAPTRIKLRLGDLDPGSRETPTTLEESREYIENAVTYMPGLGEVDNEIQVLGSPEDADPDIFEELKRTGNLDAKGVFRVETGEIFIFTDNVDSVEDAIRTLMHEGVAHKGLRVVLGDRLPALLDDVFENGNQNQIRQIAERYQLDIDNLDDRRTATEEYIAHLAESAPESTLLQRVVDAVRQFLREIGLLDSFTDNDVHSLLRDVRRELRFTPLDRITLTSQAVIEETGEVVTIEQPADVALRQHDKRASTIEKLRECLAA